TELMGHGINGVTGDYSRGAAGFWIEAGALTYPVSEVTVAGNLKDMYLHLTAASDLEFKTGMDAPTIRIDDITLARRCAIPSNIQRDCTAIVRPSAPLSMSRG